MAITIQEAAKTYSPVYNPITTLLTSTNSGQTNFRFLCDIYITGQTFAGSSYLRLKAPLHPTNSTGVFDVSGILERYLTFDIGNDVNGFQLSANSIIEYQLKFGEEYGPSSGITTYANLTVDSARYAFNGGFDFLPFTAYSQADYVTGSATRKQFTTHPTNTSQSRPQPIRSNEDAWTGVLLASSGDIKFAAIDTYNSSDVFLDAYKIINWQYFDVSPASERRLRFPVGYNLDDIAQGDIVNGVLQPIVSNASVYKWSVVFRNSSNVDVSETRWYYKDTTCTNHTEYRLHFLNKLGGFDSFTFIRASHFTADVTRKKYEKLANRYISATDYGYTAKDAGTVNFYTELKDTVKLESDWVNEDIHEWLEELVTSPVIFQDHSTYGLVRVNLTDTKHTRKKRITDRLFNMTVTLQYAHNRYRQRA